MKTSTFIPSNYETVENPVLNLTGQQIRSLCVKQTSVNFHLVEGRAWITYDDNDVIVETGETINIPASPYRVIISAANPAKAISYQLT